MGGAKPAPMRHIGAYCLPNAGPATTPPAAACAPWRPCRRLRAALPWRAPRLRPPARTRHRPRRTRRPALRPMTARASSRTVTSRFRSGAPSAGSRSLSDGFFNAFGGAPGVRNKGRWLEDNGFNVLRACNVFKLSGRPGMAGSESGRGADSRRRKCTGRASRRRGRHGHIARGGSARPADGPVAVRAAPGCGGCAGASPGADRGAHSAAAALAATAVSGLSLNRPSMPSSMNCRYSAKARP